MVLDADAKKEKNRERAKKDEKKVDDKKLSPPAQDEKDAAVIPDAVNGVPAV